MKKSLLMMVMVLGITQEASAGLILMDAFSRYSLGTGTFPSCGTGIVVSTPSVSDAFTCGTVHAEINNVGIGPGTIISNTLLGNFGSTEALASSVSTGLNENSVADANLVMFFAVIGPPAMVPLTITGTLSGTLTPSGAWIGAYLDRWFLLNYDPLTTGVFDETFIADSRFGGISGSTTLTHAVTVPALTTFELHLQANANSQGTGSASAMLDPTIQIDPSFPGASSYQILFSPNLTASAPVPEPSYLVLLGIGIAILGFAQRRRHRRT